ncbi:DUF4419 domain-containing protein [Archangium gephyra]|uniref:DUF4419 domain-containing protein n=1 Tax=Archangium gephyra TaxID=48 RepID=UPI0035D429FD
MLGTSHAQARFIRPLDTHPLVAAVHMAFSEHRPLVLSPDMVWVTIAQGLAMHIVRNAEALRSDLVRHQGRKQLVVSRSAENLASEDFWNGVIGEFSAQLHEESSALHELMVCDFSTTGTIERVVSQVVLMDALREYFDYVISCICGIPTVTLEGTPADWSRLREKVEQLSRYGLDWWAQHLLPLCDQFVRAAQGHADRDFWRSIYKLRKAYGTETINGWICKLFPFIRNSSGHYHMKNPVFESPPDSSGDDAYAPGWISSSALPTGLSRAPIVLEVQTPDGPKRGTLAIVAGFLGVSQSSRTLALRPELGWVVHKALDVDAMLWRLTDEHPVVPPLPADRRSRWKEALMRSGIPAEVDRLYSTCDGASLFGEPGRPTYRLRSAEEFEFRMENRWWRLLPSSEAPFLCSRCWMRFCDLADGSFLAFWFEGGSRLPIIWVKNTQAPYGVCVAENLGEFLRRALNSKGRPYCYEPGFTPGQRMAL